MINLLSNAIKFSGAIILNDIKSTGNSLKGREVVRLNIVDHGHGIPEDQLESIFDKFVQSDRSDKSNVGTGLGLAICREIIELHHGRIWAESSVSDSTSGASFLKSQ